MKKIVNASNGAPPVGPYNHSTNFNGLVFMSGQIALIPETGEILKGTIQEETKQVMENIRAVLTANEIGFNDILKCSIFVKNMQDYAAINEVYATYFDDDTAPARELVEVSALPKYVNIEISVIACRPS